MCIQAFVERLHNNSQRFVPILDPGIPLLPGYAPYEDGLKRGVFIADVTGQPYIGEVLQSHSPMHFQCTFYCHPEVCSLQRACLCSQ